MNYAYDRSTGCLLDTEPAVPFDRPAPQRQRQRGDTPQAAHDAAHGPAHLWARIPCAWSPERFALTMRSTPLTDAAIDRRRLDGYFGGVKAAMA